MRIRHLCSLVLTAAIVGGCAGPESAPPTALIVVDVPLTTRKVLATQLVQGAQLAAEEINADGGVLLPSGPVPIEIRAVDSEDSPLTSRDNVAGAITDGAVAVLDEGTGVDASFEDALAVGMPIGIVHLGSDALVDPGTRPNVFRIAPTDRGVAFRLAEYLLPKGDQVAVLTDDSAYGAAGAAALEPTLQRNLDQVVGQLVVPVGGDPAPQLLQAETAGATALLVWATPATVAEVVRTTRGGGWDVPIYASISASDPLVRQRLSDHPDWLDDVTFTLSRLTAERGPAPFRAFQDAYTDRFGPDLVGVTSQGRDVVQLPDFAMYTYDFVRLLARAMRDAGTAAPGDALLESMERVEVSGANGDERSFNVNSHEGVIDDDVFFATFDDMVWVPVDDDPLSSTLPSLPQLR